MEGAVKLDWFGEFHVATAVRSSTRVRFKNALESAGAEVDAVLKRSSFSTIF